MKKYTISCELKEEIVAEDEEEALSQFWQNVNTAVGEEELAEVIKTEEVAE